MSEHAKRLRIIADRLVASQSFGSIPQAQELRDTAAEIERMEAVIIGMLQKQLSGQHDISDLKRQHVEDLAKLAGDQLGRDADMYNLAEENRRLREALQHYADPKKWTEFLVSFGDIFGAQDGDQAMAFDSPDDCPWIVAAEALKP